MVKLVELCNDEKVLKHISFLRIRLLKLGFLLSLSFFFIGMFFASFYFKSFVIGAEVGLVTFILLMCLFIASYFFKYNIYELELVEKKGTSMSGRVKDIDGKWFDVSEGVLFDKIELNKPTIFYVSGKAIVDFYAKSIYEKHTFITAFLTHIGVSYETALEDACKIEHDLSIESFEKLKEFCIKNNIVK